MYGGQESLPTPEFKPSLWSGFYKKTIKERQNLLKLLYPHLFIADGQGQIRSNKGLDTPSVSSARTPRPVHHLEGGEGDPFPICGLSDNVADVMVENCIG
jgi:hypothetical protein